MGTIAVTGIEVKAEARRTQSKCNLYYVSQGEEQVIRLDPSAFDHPSAWPKIWDIIALGTILVHWHIGPRAWDSVLCFTEERSR